MKSKQEFHTWSVEECNQLIKHSFNRNYWIFLIQQMQYPEIKFDEASNQISCPTFIPFRDLALEVVQDLNKRKKTIKPCLVCSRYFDINQEDGIFGDTTQLEKFICNACANKISAKEFYEHHLVM
ncbi:MAG: hypothetical protein H7839_01635 [Magnetococcus sp. YQC-5]